MRYLWIVPGLIAGFFAGQWSGNGGLRSEADLRSAIGEYCVGNSAMLAEIDERLPDNDQGLITPAILRQVLDDVVRKCR